MSGISDTTQRTLVFSGPRVRADLVERVKNLAVRGRTIVVNLDVTPAYLVEEPRRPIPALSATTVVDTQIESAAALVLLTVDPDQDVPTIIDEPGWFPFGSASDSGRAPLWRSPSDDGGLVTFDPATVLGEESPHGLRTFRIELKLWYAPAGTDCGLHNRHEFIETHAQVSGTGRMQKFRADDFATLYEDVVMGPGYATPTPFCGLGAGPSFVYPWHQYHADTHCVWLAVEYHLVPNGPAPSTMVDGR